MELHVWQWNGNDTTGDGSPTKPFLTIQKAVDVAPQQGCIIKVAGGVYPPFSIINGKWLQIQGSFLPPDWTTPNPAGAPSWVDGQYKARCITVAGGIPALVMSYLNCRNGQCWQYGGGLYAISSAVDIRHCKFIACKVFGTSPDGGVAAGGGCCIFYGQGPVIIEDCEFSDNLAMGGAGDSGGYGQGGGLFIAESTVTLNRILAFRNTCQGGTSMLTGLKNGFETADGVGGGIDLEGCFTHLDTCELANNLSLGGSNEKGWAGGGFGGGLEAEFGELTLSNGNIHHNTAQGGYGWRSFHLEGSYGSGGGLDLTNSGCSLINTNVHDNTTHGGDTYLYQLGPFGTVHIQESNGKTLYYNLNNLTVMNNWLRFGKSRAGNVNPDYTDRLGVDAVYQESFSLTNQSREL